MCVIVSKYPGQPIPPDIVEDCFYANPDGFGVAYLKNGRLLEKKGLFTLQQTQKIVRKLRHFRAFLHFRIRTAGPISDDNCHPFRVAGDRGLMVHNGCLDLETGPDRSDTAELAEILQTHSQRDIIRGRDMLENWHGGGNRLAFLFDDGSSMRTGKWFVEQGLQFSNLHWQTSFSYGFACPQVARKRSKKCQWCETATVDLNEDALCDGCSFRYFQ